MSRWVVWEWIQDERDLRPEGADKSICFLSYDKFVVLEGQGNGEGDGITSTPRGSEVRRLFKATTSSDHPETIIHLNVSSLKYREKGLTQVLLC